MSTKIPYANLGARGESWSPTSGCSGAGCTAKCWSRALAHRFHRDFTPQFHPERLSDPLHWKMPRRVLVSFNGDLFDVGISDAERDQVFGVVLACNYFVNKPDHTWIVLTKQAANLARYMTAEPALLVERWARAVDRVARCDDGDVWFHEAIAAATAAVWNPIEHTARGAVKPWSHPENVFPLRRLWLGVSVSTQAEADERIPRLLQCPAAVRWVSYEPALGPVDFRRIKPWHPVHGPDGADALAGGSWGHELISIPACSGPGYCNHSDAPTLDWIACSGESGPGARPCDLDWIRRVRDDCAACGVAFAFKDQVGFPPLDGAVHDALPVTR